jgi:hypothetical protein
MKVAMDRVRWRTSFISGVDSRVTDTSLSHRMRSRGIFNQNVLRYWDILTFNVPRKENSYLLGS